MSKNQHKKSNMAFIVSNVQKSVQKPSLSKPHISVDKQKHLDAQKKVLNQDNVTDNNHLISTICQSIQNAHTNSIELTQVIAKSRQEKVLSFVDMHYSTLEKINTASCQYFNNFFPSVKMQSPDALIETQFESMKKLHHSYIDFMSTISKKIFSFNASAVSR